MDFAKSLKLRFLVGDLNLPERRNKYTSSREEGRVDPQIDVPLRQINKEQNSLRGKR